MGTYTSYFYNDGSQAKNTWVDVNGNSYWMDNVGHAYTGLHDMGGFTSYFWGDGSQAKNTSVNVNGRWYNFDWQGHAY
ncbi:hypothetical protein WECO103172_10920 [Weissella confusa]